MKVTQVGMLEFQIENTMSFLSCFVEFGLTKL
jgi:hypothetical protein